jgi:hypothetical protein
MATGKPPPAFVAQPSRLHAMGGHGCAGEKPAPQSFRARLVMHAGRVHHKDPGCLVDQGRHPHHKASRPAFVAQPSRLHAMGGQESEINPDEGGYNKQGGIK